MSWVGALTPSNYPDLIEIDLSDYHGFWKGRRYYRCEKEVMGIQCSVILTYYGATSRKQEHSLKRGIDKLKALLREKWNA